MVEIDHVSSGPIRDRRLQLEIGVVASQLDVENRIGSDLGVVWELGGSRASICERSRAEAESGDQRSVSHHFQRAAPGNAQGRAWRETESAFFGSAGAVGAYRVNKRLFAIGKKRQHQ